MAIEWNDKQPIYRQLREMVVERVLEVTELKPYRIQRVCLALVNRLHEEKRRTVTLADVEAISGRGLA